MRETAPCRCQAREARGHWVEFADGHRELLCYRCCGLIRRDPEGSSTQEEDFANDHSLLWWLSGQSGGGMGIFPAVLLALVVAAVLSLSGCARPQVPPASAEITWVCTTCFSNQPLGHVPLTVTFFAVRPDNAQYFWDFGDGRSGSGRVVSHSYTVPGLYRVQLNAVVKRGVMEKRYSAEVYIKALALPDKPVARAELDTDLYAVAMVFPKALALGESGQFCLYVTAKAALTVFSADLAESYSLMGDGEFNPIWLYVPAGRSVEHCVVIRRISTVEAFVEYHLFGATEREGVRRHGRVTVVGINNPVR